MKKINRMYIRKESVDTNPNSYQKYDNYGLKKLRLGHFTIPNIKPNKIMQDKYREDKINIIKNIILFLMLIVLFTLVYGILIILIHNIFNKYRYYIIKIWLGPALIQLLIVKFCINYGLNLFRSYMLFNYYAMRKTRFWPRLFYTLFVGEYFIHMYEIRNFITKYFTDLKQIKENKKEK